MPFSRFYKKEKGILHDKSCHTHIVSYVCVTYLDYVYVTCLDYVCVTCLNYVCVTCLDTVCVTACVWHDSTMGWLQSVGSMKL